jgi:hypothetical protein
MTTPSAQAALQALERLCWRSVHASDEAADEALLRQFIEGAELNRVATSVGLQCLRACEELPEGYEMHVALERGAGWPILYNEDGDCPDLDGISVDHLPFDGRLAAVIDLAIAARSAEQKGKT